MVEFALALPVLLLVIYGLIETGRLLFIYASVVTAARQAARYGSATGVDSSGEHYYNDCAGIEAAARRLQFIQRFSSVDISFDNPGPPAWGPENCPIPASEVGHPINGDRIRVTVSALYTPIVPLVPIRPFTIASTSNRTLLVGAYIAMENPSQGFHGSGTQGFVLTKWANTDYYHNIGDKITYHYTIQNTGTTPLAGEFYILDTKIAHSDPRGNPCTGAPNPLPGPSAVITCPDQVYTITAADITSPEVTNHARAQNADGSIVSNEAVYTVSFVPEPHITLVKVGEPPKVVDVGATVNYTFTITNDGNVPLQPPYAITDTLLGSHNANCPSTPATLDLGASVVCTGAYSLKSGDISSAVITNTASATAMFGSSVVTSGSVTVDTPIPLLQLTDWSVDVNPYTSLNQKLTFTYYFQNRGTKTLSSLGITSTKSGTVSCPASIASGASNHCTMTYLVSQDDLDAGTILDTVTMQGSQTGPPRTWTSNALSVSVPGTQVGGVTIDMAATPLSPPTPPAFAVGDSIQFSFTFQNSGNIRLKGPYTITSDDPRIATVTCAGPTPLAIGASATCPPVAIILTQADMDAGRFTIHATGIAYPNIGTALVTPGTDDVTVITYTLPRIALVKTPSRTTFTGAGDTISYSYGLKNTGGLEDLTATAFVLQDSKLGAINCSAGTIAVGAVVDCGSLNYTSTDADVAALVISNDLTYVSGTATGASGPAPNPPKVTVNVPLLKCDSNTLKSSTIADGTSQTWLIWNKTGTDLHITGGWMRWNNPVLLTQVYLGTTLVNINGASILLLPGSGWPVLPYIPGTKFDSTDATPMILKFSGTASGIKVYLTFQETFSGLTCTLSSP